MKNAITQTSLSLLAFISCVNTHAAPTPRGDELTHLAQGARVELSTSLASMDFARMEYNSLKFQDGHLVRKQGSSDEVRDGDCYVIAHQSFTPSSLLPRKILIAEVLVDNFDPRSNTSRYQIKLVDHGLESINCRFRPDSATVEGFKRGMSQDFGMISIPSGWQYVN